VTVRRHSLLTAGLLSMLFLCRLRRLELSWCYMLDAGLLR